MTESTTSEEQVTIQEFARVKLAVAEVKEVLPHPRADRLLLLKVDVGGGEPLQLVAGLKGYYEPEGLVGRQVVVVRNLVPATLRGERSEGMVLAAVVDDNEPVLLTVDKPVANGSQIR
jgi:methionine--tRNA ligase beta chain